MVRDFADRITWIALADGEKAVLLRDDGMQDRASLSVIEARVLDNPPNREQASAPPGRMNDGRGGVRKSSFEETDFHLLGKARFAKDFTETLNRAALSAQFDRLLIVAPPETLGEMRAHYHPELARRLIGEVGRDLTNHPIREIEENIGPALRGA